MDFPGRKILTGMGLERGPGGPPAENLPTTELAAPARRITIGPLGAESPVH